MRRLAWVIIVLCALVAPALAACTANFTMSQTSGNYPLTVSFADQSVCTPAANGWAWNFGDGLTNATSTSQNPTYTYTYTGTFNPQLLVSNANGDNGTYTWNSILINQTPTNASTVSNQAPPKIVQFHAVSIWGKQIANATITVQGLSTTTGTWSWVSTLLSIPLDEAPIQNSLMTGVTDSYGTTEFTLVPTTKYNVTATSVGYIFPSIYIYPHDNEYTIVASGTNDTSWVNSGAGVAATKIINVSTVKFTDTLQAVNVSYVDTTATTTGGYINITQGATVLVSHHIVSSSFWLNQSVTVPIGGTSVTVDANIITSGGNVSKSYMVSFTGPPVTLAGIDPEIMMWMSLFLIVLTGLIATSSTGPAVSIIVCFEAWFFLAVGWLNSLVADVGLSQVVGLFSLATILAVLWTLRDGKRKETGR